MDPNTISFYVQGLQVAAGIPAAYKALKDTISGWTSGKKLETEELRQVENENAKLRDCLTTAFQINAELRRWKLIHDGFHSFRSTTRELDRLLLDVQSADDINLSSVKEYWDDELHGLRVRNNLKADVFPLTRDLEEEELEPKLSKHAVIGEYYQVAVENKNLVIDLLAKTEQMLEDFTSLVDKGEDKDKIQKMWPGIRSSSVTILKYANTVLISLISIINHYYGTIQSGLD